MMFSATNPYSNSTQKSLHYQKSSTQSGFNFPSKYGIEIRLRDMRLLASPFIEDIAAFSGCIWWCINFYLWALFLILTSERGTYDLRCKLTATFSESGLLILCNPRLSLMYVTSFSSKVVSLITLGAASLGKSNLVSFNEPWRTFMIQWASAWSWIGLPFPGVQTSTN